MTVRSHGWKMGLTAAAGAALLASAFGAEMGCGSDESAVVGGHGASSGGGGAAATGGAGGLILMGGGGSGTGGGSDTCNPPCTAEQVCSHGVCVPLNPCTGPDDCQNDTYCDPNVGCLPWATHDPSYDPGCIQVIPPGVLAPRVQCEFSVPPANDPFPNHVDVQGSPLVV